MADSKITIKSRSAETAFDRANLISWWRQDIVSSSRVLVIGAGAIGNETLKNLALLGVGNIFICDMDTISVSNLSRTVLFSADDVGKQKAEIAAARVLKMSNNPNCKVDYFIGDIVHQLGHGVFRRFDVVLGCLDNMMTRADVNRRSCLFQKPYLDAGISELGLSLNVHHYPNSSCLACGMDSNDIAMERRVRFSCDVFKQRAIEEGHAATVLISTALVSALQVQETIKILHHLNNARLEVPVQFGKKYYFQGINNTFERVSIPSNDDCSAHFSFESVVETPLSSSSKLRDVLEFAEEKMKVECILDTYPDSAFVTTAQCIKCRKEIRLDRPMFDIYSDELFCENCCDNAIKGFTPSYKAINEFSTDMEEGYLLDFSLERLGVPPLHVITIREKNNYDNAMYLELTGDLDRIMPSISKGINYKSKVM